MAVPARARRWIGTAGCMLVVMAGILVVAMGRDALAAERHLNQGRSQLALTRSALATADVPRALAHLNRAQTFTAEARAETSNWLWRSIQHVPLVGPSAAAVSTSADVANQIASHVLPGLLSSAEGLDLPALRAGSGLRLEPLSEAAPHFTRAARQVTRQDRRMAQLNGPLPGRLHHGVQQLRDQLRELRSSLRDAGEVAQVLPPLLGGSGPRRYLVVVENPAEARGTGGLIGAYGVLTADRGRSGSRCWARTATWPARADYRSTSARASRPCTGMTLPSGGMPT